MNVYKGVYKGGKHPPIHQQALQLCNPIPSMLTPRPRGCGECFELWQTKPARSGSSASPPAPRTGRHWAARAMGALISLPAAIMLAQLLAQELGDRGLAGV